MRLEVDVSAHVDSVLGMFSQTFSRTRAHFATACKGADCLMREGNSTGVRR